MIKTAVILAAGMGTRIQDIVMDRPKGFLKICSNPIIEDSIVSLLESGIERIIIGTGYQKKYYEQLINKYPQIICVPNEQYQKTGSMYTLSLLKNEVKEDFLLLESDLIYEKRALDHLIKIPYGDTILASRFTSSGDEVFIETDQRNRLINMNKRISMLSRIDGELVGISRISYPTFKMMCKYMEDMIGNKLALDYEEALVWVSKQKDIYVDKLPALLWCEIDNKAHLLRAVTDIYPKIKERDKVQYNQKDTLVERKVLLNPGPATTSDRVKLAQVVSDICPREKEFGEVLSFISTELTKVVASPEEYVTVLFGGSGTAAVEAIIGSVIGQEDYLLVINNGAYGQRICQMAEIYGIPYLEWQSSSYEALDIKRLEIYIEQSSKKITHLAVVHHETTTGLLNNITTLGDICSKHNIQLIVDAMSSFGAIPINMKEMHIHYLAASSNKNLQSMAGVSFVIANNKQIERTKSIKPRNLYLHLYDQYQYFIFNSQMRFTPPVQTLYALKEAIIELKEEGIENRYNRYKRLWGNLTKGIERLRLSYLVKKEHQSNIVTAIIEPNHKNYHFSEMHDFLYEKGITIYPGKLNQLNTFRVANMGDIDEADIDKFLKYLEQYLKGIGYLTS